MNFKHKPVLLEQCMTVLKPERGGIFVDCTAGGGGHSGEIAKRLPYGSRLISIDRDIDAVRICRERLSPYGAAVSVIKSNYSNIASVLDALEIDAVDGILWDLGVSSYQLDEPERGFSYMNDAPLDMRMDRDNAKNADDVVNGYSEDELKRVIFDYGEEKFAGRIASAIVSARESSRIKSTTELASIISGAIPAAARHSEAQHPAKRTFQAIRIEVNGELDVIEPSIRAGVGRLKPGGIAAVITFHSLEDRIVKQTFVNLVSPCTCPPDFPVCVCHKKPEVKQITRKPIIPDAAETEDNPRARSSKLRAVEKL